MKVQYLKWKIQNLSPTLIQLPLNAALWRALDSLWVPYGHMNTLNSSRNLHGSLIFSLGLDSGEWFGHKTIWVMPHFILNRGSLQLSPLSRYRLRKVKSGYFKKIKLKTIPKNYTEAVLRLYSVQRTSTLGKGDVLYILKIL